MAALPTRIRTRTQSDRTVLVLDSGSGFYHSDLVGALPGAGISIGVLVIG